MRASDSADFKSGEFAGVECFVDCCAKDTQTTNRQLHGRPGRQSACGDVQIHGSEPLIDCQIFCGHPTKLYRQISPIRYNTLRPSCTLPQHQLKQSQTDTTTQQTVSIPRWCDVTRRLQYRRSLNALLPRSRSAVHCASYVFWRAAS